VLHFLTYKTHIWTRNMRRLSTVFN